MVARSDYAGNAGNARTSGITGPEDLGSVKTFKNWITDTQNGITYQRSRVRMAQITDGTSKTALIGEKYINPARYEDGSDPADDQNIFVGHDQDTLRYTGRRNNPTSGAVAFDPQQDTVDVDKFDDPSFGSAHSGIMNMAFCDGSVQSIEYAIDPAVYYFYGGRDDDGTPYPGP
jgi:prepilin-type processing-associated H-X9-DG protein